MRFEKKINFYTPIEFGHEGKEPTPTSDPDNPDTVQPSPGPDDDNSSSSNTTTLVLAIAIPIACIFIIVGIILFLRHKRNSAMNSRDEIEKLTGNELTESGA